MDINLVGEILEDAKKIAVKYKTITGKSIGITSEIAEYEAAIKLNCNLCPAGNPGYDLLDKDGKQVQVKGRVYKGGGHRVPTINESTATKPWDYVVLVLLNEEYETISIHEISKEKLEAHFTKPRPRNGKNRRNIAISEFKRISKQVWPPKLD